MKVIEKHNPKPVRGTCPYCKSVLEIEKNDVYWAKDISGTSSPYVKCAACGKTFDVEAWDNIHYLY